MRKIFSILLVLIMLVGCNTKQEQILSEIPKGELAEGQRGELGIDKNINEETIDNYLNREDVAYFDMRMLSDPANYEKIDGDSMLSGYIKGFTIVSYPYLCNVIGLPEAVGESYKGQTLFTVDEENNYTPNFKESKEILETIFPKDKYIFLMCGGGGYAGMTKNLLISQGWDKEKIYDIGGYWFYNGQNKVEIPVKNNIYDFSNVPYIEINFNKLTELSEEEKTTNMIELTGTELEKLEKKCEYFMLYVYAPGCVGCEKFKPILNEYLEQNNLTVYTIQSSEFTSCNSTAKECVKYTPSVVVYNEGEILSYLDPSSDKDSKFFENVENFNEWMKDKTEQYCLGDKKSCDGACSISGH